MGQRITYATTGGPSSYYVHANGRLVGTVARKADGWHALAVRREPGDRSHQDVYGTRAEAAEVLARSVI